MGAGLCERKRRASLAAVVKDVVGYERTNTELGSQKANGKKGNGKAHADASPTFAYTLFPTQGAMRKVEKVGTIYDLSR